MNAKNSRTAARICGGLGLGILLLLTGCAGTPYMGGWSQHPSAEQYAVVRSQPIPPAARPATASYQR